MLKIRQDDKLYIVELLLVAGICLFTMLQNSSMVSKLFYLTFFVLLLGLFLQLHNKPWLNELHILAALIIVISFFHVALQAETWSFGYYKKLIMFSCTVLIIPFLDATIITKKHVNLILGINLCIAALYPVMYFFLDNPGYLGRYLTFHHSNPNATAMFLLHSMLYCGIALYYFKKRVFRLLVLALTLMLVYFIYLTEARSCYIAIAFFVVLVFLNVGLKKDVKFSPKLSLFVLLLPLIIALIYLAVVDSGLLERIFSFFDLGEGKALDSRASIWKEAMEAFVGKPIFGDYYGITMGESGHLQMHNTHLDILASYGILPFVLFVVLLYRKVLRVLPGTTTKFSRMALFAFFAVIIQGTFEAALVSGGMGLYIMSFGFLLLAKFNRETDGEKVVKRKNSGNGTE